MLSQLGAKPTKLGRGWVSGDRDWRYTYGEPTGFTREGTEGRPSEPKLDRLSYLPSASVYRPVRRSTAVKGSQTRSVTTPRALP